MPEQFRVQQALFGYREGHNLLAASVSLPPRVRHFLATVTDSSGTEAAEGFNCAFTGISVPETDYYALFCTWPAPEMPRPGCVWSHVLLIELTNLAQIPDLSILRKLCRRPPTSVTQSFGDYSQELTLDSSNDAETPIGVVEQQRASALFAALYQQPESSVVVLDEKCSLWEEIVFAIWSQQWPRLRRSFAFSTGSLGDRRLAGIAFDLQVAPLSSQRLWRRAGSSTVVVDLLSNSAEQTSAPGWMTIVLDDLEQSCPRRLRQFLFTYGSDMERPRFAFSQLVNAYTILNSEPDLDWTERLRSLARIFPNESEALRLKEWVLTPSDNLDAAQNLERAWSTAAFLLNAPEARAYAKLPFDHAGLAPLLWEKKRDEVLALIARLVRKDENPSATAFALAIGKSIQPSELHPISNRYPELIPIFISHRIELARDVGTWQLPGYVQSQIFEVLESLHLNQQEWGEIMGAMFLAATYTSIRSAVRNAGPYAMQGAFRWLDGSIANELLPSQTWRDALVESAVDQLTTNTTLPPAKLAFCSWFVSPDAILRFLSSDRSDVQQLAQEPLDILPKPLQTHVAFLLVALGLRANTIKGIRLISRGYFQVYSVLAASRATSEEWSLLSSELPRIGRWGDWDRCERLRRSVRKWLLQHASFGNPLLEAAETSEQSEIARQILSSETVSKDDDDFRD